MVIVDGGAVERVELVTEAVDKVVEVWLCPLRLETLDPVVEVAVTVGVVVMEATAVPVEVAAGAADGKLALATKPRTTAMRTAPPTPAITLGNSDILRPSRRRLI